MQVLADDGGGDEGVGGTEHGVGPSRASAVGIAQHVDGSGYVDDPAAQAWKGASV